MITLGIALVAHWANALFAGLAVYGFMMDSTTIAVTFTVLHLGTRSNFDNRIPNPV